MSHRIAIKTNIKNRKIAEKALTAQGWEYQAHGDNIRVTSGPMARSIINFKTGVVEGDTDRHSSGTDSLGALKQAYVEAYYRNAMDDCGGYVESREVLEGGKIRMVINDAGASARSAFG